MIQSGRPASPLACAGRKLGRRLSHIAEGRYEAKFADTAPCRSTGPPSSHRGGPESSLRGRQEAAIVFQLARCCSPDGGHCHPGQLTMSCAAPEASPREQVGTKHVVGGTSYGDDPTSLRDSAIRLAEAGQVRAAIPLFQAVVALDPSKPLGHSDEGVSWMRLKEYDQARPCDPRLSDARVNALPPQPCHRLPPWLPPCSLGARSSARSTSTRRTASRCRTGETSLGSSRTHPKANASCKPLCGEQVGSAFGQLALRRRLSAPARVTGCRELPSLDQ